MSTYIPGTLETDPKKINMSLQQIGPSLDTATTNIATNTASIATNATAIAALNAATYVNSIAASHGAFTLNSTSGITNSTNDIVLSQASSSQFGAVKVDGTSITAASGVISTRAASQITASLSGDVSLNNTANYFDGPSIAQGTSGTWWVSGTVTLTDASNAQFFCKLWDGTTVIASADQNSIPTGFVTVSLSGFITSPAANLRISCRDSTTTAGKISFNASGNSKDSTISAFRIG